METRTLTLNYKIKLIAKIDNFRPKLDVLFDYLCFPAIPSIYLIKFGCKNASSRSASLATDVLTQREYFRYCTSQFKTFLFYTSHQYKTYNFIRVPWPLEFYIDFLYNTTLFNSFEDQNKFKMYVTRPLSHYIQNPESLSSPPDGPNSGYLVLQDEASITRTFFGLCKNNYFESLPFPQNKNLTIRTGTTNDASYKDIVFVPVVNQPLSLNRYYAIKPHGSHKGKAYACSLDENVWTATCCSCCFPEEDPRPFDPTNMYQQFQIRPYKTFFGSNGDFTTQSVALDGIPPYFLRRKGWEIKGKTPKYFELGEALGVNAKLRSQLPAFNFPLSFKNSEPVTVGKWYCPFMFIKDGTLKDQMKMSMYYEMTLEQRWEQIFACENRNNQSTSVNIDVEVETETVFIRGTEAVRNEENVVNGVVWFKSTNGVGEQKNIGLSLLIIERMKWEVIRFGWAKGGNRRVKVNKIEEFSGVEGWKKFRAYALVERFKLKRMDGSVALTYDFKHIQLMRSKWE